MQTRLTTVALFFWVALIGPVARAAGTPNARPGLVLAVSLAAATAVFSTGATNWRLRLLIATGAGVFLVPSHGEQLGLWLTTSLLLAAWLAQARPPLPFLAPPSRGVAAPVAVLCGVAAWSGHSATTTWQPMVPFAMACLALLSPLGGERIASVGRRIGDVAATAVSTVAFVFVGSLVVVLPWLGQRLLLVDPLSGQAGWSPRRARAVRPGEPWEREAAMPRQQPSGGRWARRAARGAAAVAVGAAVLLLRPWPLSGAGSGEMPLVAPIDATDSQEWYGEYREDIAWVTDERVALRPFDIYRLLDVRTRHVNIDEGARVTWTPPPCNCERITVWLYGGSAAFGLEQRDGHTVASELARVAAENGIALDVRNGGLPGQGHWRTALRFGWDLTNEEPPDLAIFYEGAEEVAAAAQLTERGLGDVRAPYEADLENLYDEIYDVEAPLPPPEGVEALAWPTRPDDDASRSVGALAADRYHRSREISRNTAERYGVPIRYVWHPSRPTEDPNDAFRDAATHLPPDVLDLTDLLSRQPDVEFADEIHHDERGARISAEALFASFEPELRELSGVGGPP